MKIHISEVRRSITATVVWNSDFEEDLPDGLPDGINGGHYHEFSDRSGAFYLVYYTLAEAREAKEVVDLHNIKLREREASGEWIDPLSGLITITFSAELTL